MTSTTAAESDPALQDAPTEGQVIRWAKHYDRVMALFTLGREAQLRRRTVDAAALQPGERVLDVGCGTGTLAVAAADCVGEAGSVLGIDPSANMVTVARAKAGGRLSPRFETAAIEQLPIADASVDVVLSSLMFHHLTPSLQRRGLLEVRRVLRPGGRLVIVDMAGRGPLLHRLIGRFVAHGDGHGHGHGDGHGHGLQGVAAVVEELGFIDVLVSPFRPRFLGLLTARLPDAE